MKKVYEFRDFTQVDEIDINFLRFYQRFRINLNIYNKLCYGNKFTKFTFSSIHQDCTQITTR
jgi:hypothetical protein